MDQRRREDETSAGEYIAKAAMDVEHGVLGRAIKTHAKTIAPGTRVALKVVRPGGYAMDVADVFTSENKLRAGAKVVGGILGAAAGAAGGLGLASPLTGAIGGAAGSWAGGELYDAGEDIVGDILDWREDNRRRQDETRRFIEQRNAAERRAHGR
jgi:hypothetical protein